MNTPMLTRYEQAHRILKGKKNNDIVRNDTVHPHWINYADGSDSDYFWYQKQTAAGKEFRWVDVGAETNEPAFDHALLASLLTEALSNVKGLIEDNQETACLQEKSDQAINPLDLPLTAVAISASKSAAKKEDALQVSFKAMDKLWLFEPDNASIKEAPPAQLSGFISPDGKKTAFTREHNIWIRDLSSGEEQQMTQDGADKRVNGEAAGGKEDVLLWSGDSQYLLFTQRDRRETKTRHYINYAPLDGSLEAELVEIPWSYASDEPIGGWRLFVVNVRAGETQKANYPLIPDWLVAGQLLCLCF